MSHKDLRHSLVLAPGIVLSVRSACSELCCAVPHRQVALWFQTLVHCHYFAHKAIREINVGVIGHNFT